MVPSVADFALRCTVGAVVLSCIWVSAHLHPRDRVIRFLLPAIATAGTLVMIHLPRVDFISWIEPVPPVAKTGAPTEAPVQNPDPVQFGNRDRGQDLSRGFGPNATTDPTGLFHTKGK